MIYLLLFSLVSNFVAELRKEKQIPNNQHIAIIYMEMVDCVKCYLEPLEMADYLNKNNVKVIAAINCDREIELKVFKRDKGWKYDMIVDEDRKTREKLGGEEYIYMTIIKQNGKVKHFTKSREKNTTNENIKKVNEFLR